MDACGKLLSTKETQVLLHNLNKARSLIGQVSVFYLPMGVRYWRMLSCLACVDVKRDNVSDRRGLKKVELHEFSLLFFDFLPLE